MHSAKGAEWDFVAVPGLAEKNFPNAGRKSDSWIKNAGAIPVSMRGDYEQLPVINFANFSTNKNLKDGLEKFGDEWKARKAVEEMRLAYVAFTRVQPLTLEMVKMQLRLVGYINCVPNFYLR